MPSPAAANDLWNAVHAAYEAHAPEEARRLLQSNSDLVDCSLIVRCGDEDYLRWLLSNDLLPSEALAAVEAWPGLQERQLQCDALPAAQRPRCILQGDWDESGSQPGAQK